jgi:hypothetical protein
MTRKEKTALVVLGMHRSGTSALARTLNIFGASIGDDLFPAQEIDNPTGYWENVGLFSINDHLLKEFGVDYLVSDDLPAGWTESPPATRAKAAICEVLKNQFEGKNLIAIKDPRLCFLGPLYFQVLADRGYAIKVIMPLRAPSEVAASLAKRMVGKIYSQVEFEAIWARTVLSAELLSRPYPRMVTTYRQLLEDPFSIYDDLEKRLSIGWPVHQKDAAEAIGEFIDPALQRNVFTEVSAVPAIRKLFEVLTNLDRGAQSQRVRAYLDSWTENHLFLYSSLQKRIQRIARLERTMAERLPEPAMPEGKVGDDVVTEARKTEILLKAGEQLLHRYAQLVPHKPGPDAVPAK